MRAAADAGSRALALGRGRLGGSGARFPLEPTDGADDSDERLVNVDTLLGRRLNALGAEALGEVATLVGLDLALVLEVALVGDNDDGEVVSVLDAENLLVERRNLLERAARSDRVDEQEALAWEQSACLLRVFTAALPRVLTAAALLRVHYGASRRA